MIRKRAEKITASREPKRGKRRVVEGLEPNDNDKPASKKLRRVVSRDGKGTGKTQDSEIEVEHRGNVGRKRGEKSDKIYKRKRNVQAGTDENAGETVEGAPPGGEREKVGLERLGEKMGSMIGRKRKMRRAGK